MRGGRSRRGVASDEISATTKEQLNSGSNLYKPRARADARASENFLAVPRLKTTPKKAELKGGLDPPDRIFGSGGCGGVGGRVFRNLQPDSESLLIGWIRGGFGSDSDSQESESGIREQRLINFPSCTVLAALGILAASSASAAEKILTDAFSLATCASVR